jgi:hypothetical protein
MREVRGYHHCSRTHCLQAGGAPFHPQLGTKFLFFISFYALCLGLCPHPTWAEWALCSVCLLLLLLLPRASSSSLFTLLHTCLVNLLRASRT